MAESAAVAADLTSASIPMPRDDRATMAFAQSLLRKMLSDQVSEKHYDVYFIVRIRQPRDAGIRETRLGAHRVVLSAVSDQFERHARPASVSSSGGSAASLLIDEITVADCSAAAIREALRLIYGGEPGDALQSVSLALDLWRFGVTFHVDHLIALARSACLANLSTDNCLRILDFAVHVNDVHIVDKLQNYASENAHFAHVISSPHFQYLHFDVIRSLVRPGKGECAWPDILTFEKVWFDAIAKWLALRVLSDYKDDQDSSGDYYLLRNSTRRLVPLSSTKLSTAASDSEPAPASTSVPVPSKDVASTTAASQRTSFAAEPSEGIEQSHVIATPTTTTIPSTVEDDDDDENDDDENDDDDDETHSHDDVQVFATPENLQIVEKALELIDFSRMKTHELREVSKNPVAGISPTFHRALVEILLTRSEELEASVLERNIDLDVIGQKYQQALCEQDEAERKARAAVEKMDRLQAAKVTLERRFEEIRKKKKAATLIAGSSGPASLNSARRKMSGSSTII